MPFWSKKKPEPMPPLPSAANIAPNEPASIEPATDEPRALVTFDDDNRSISLNVTSVPEAKLAIKQLRLKKKEINLVKKEISLELSSIRADRSASVASQGSMIRGGGGFNRFARDMQRMSRDSARAAHGREVASLQDRKAWWDGYASAIDRSILRCEEFIIMNSD